LGFDVRVLGPVVVTDQQTDRRLEYGRARWQTVDESMRHLHVLHVDRQTDRQTAATRGQALLMSDEEYAEYAACARRGGALRTLRSADLLGCGDADFAAGVCHALLQLVDRAAASLPCTSPEADEAALAEVKESAGESSFSMAEAWEWLPYPSFGSKAWSKPQSFLLRALECLGFRV
jgi:hypothetical protein